MATASASFVPEALRIVHRPEQIEQRQLPGHCDDDFIAGAFNHLDPTSLSDAETAEDLSQQFVAAEPAGDLRQRLLRQTQILGGEFGTAACDQ